MVGDYAISEGTLSAGPNYATSFTPGVFTIIDQASWRDSLPQVSLITNPLWQNRPGVGLVEIVENRPRVIWIGAGRSDDLPRMQTAERGPYLPLFMAQPSRQVPGTK
jgi:hypothetical protein